MKDFLDLDKLADEWQETLRLSEPQKKLQTKECESQLEEVDQVYSQELDEQQEDQSNGDAFVVAQEFSENTVDATKFALVESIRKLLKSKLPTATESETENGFCWDLVEDKVVSLERGNDKVTLFIPFINSERTPRNDPLARRVRKNNIIGVQWSFDYSKGLDPDQEKYVIGFINRNL